MSGRRHSRGPMRGAPTGPAQGDMLTGRWMARTAPPPPKERVTLMPLPERIAHHEAAAANLQRLGEGGGPAAQEYLSAAANCRRHIEKLRAELAAGGAS